MTSSVAMSEVLMVRARQALLNGDANLAHRWLHELLDGEPRHAAALHLYGMCRAELGEYQVASVAIESALTIDPDQAGWRRDLAAIHFAMGHYERAVCALQEALQHRPNDFEGQQLYGRALLALGRYGPAIQAFAEACRINPRSPEPALGMAQAHARQFRYGDAATICQELLTQNPDHPATLRLLGEICHAARRPQEAREVLEHLLEIVPGDPAALATIVLACWSLDDLAETLRHSRALIATGRATPALHAFHLFTQLHGVESTPASIRESCEGFGRTLALDFRTSWPRGGAEDSDRRLRIGYLTGEFIHGPAFFFLSSLLGNHDPAAVEVFCYHTRRIFDAETDWFRRAGTWRDCSMVSDDAITQQIRRDGIDVLVDLSAFFPENKLQIFARRAAPIQVTYPNCPTTTGIGNMDYILTDRWTCPAGLESQYTEQPVFLPSGYLMYTPPPGMPGVGPLPALRNGYVTFGMFQRQAKTNGAVWDAVAQILRCCPGSRLLVQTGAGALDYPSSLAYAQMRRQFSDRGIDEDRVRLVGKRPQAATLEHMSEVDIALDTFPYQGQTTTCECLWLGVPVVALSGRAHVARVGTALLERVGLGNLTASTSDEYIETAVRLAGDVPALAAMRQGMRDRLRRSTLLDGRKLASEVEAAYRHMWTRWLSQQE